MKKIFLLLAIVPFLFSYSQKIGIVYNINPNMGYTFLKGTFKATPVIEKELNYNYINFLTDYLKENNIEYKILTNFDFSEMEHFNPMYKQKKRAKYVNDFCNENGIDKLLIIAKIDLYKITSPTQIFYGLQHDFGIATLKISKKRALLYYNFFVIPYEKGADDFHGVFGGSYLTHKFENNIYNSDYDLINSSVIDYYLPKLESFMKENLNFFMKK